MSLTFDEDLPQLVTATAALSQHRAVGSCVRGRLVASTKQGIDTSGTRLEPPSIEGSVRTPRTGKHGRRARGSCPEVKPSTPRMVAEPQASCPNRPVRGHPGHVRFAPLHASRWPLRARCEAVGSRGLTMAPSPAVCQQRRCSAHSPARQRAVGSRQASPTGSPHQCPRSPQQLWAVADLRQALAPSADHPQHAVDGPTHRRGISCDRNSDDTSRRRIAQRRGTQRRTDRRPPEASRAVCLAGREAKWLRTSD